jgi:Protein of unknown function (DUF2442)
MVPSTVETSPRALDLRITDDELTVLLTDGRRISAPLVWFPRLLNATKEQRDEWELLGDGEGIHWPAVDEDLSVAGLLRGTPAPGSPAWESSKPSRTAQSDED